MRGRPGRRGGEEEEERRRKKKVERRGKTERKRENEGEVSHVAPARDSLGRARGAEERERGKDGREEEEEEEEGEGGRTRRVMAGGGSERQGGQKAHEERERESVWKHDTAGQISGRALEGDIPDSRRRAWIILGSLLGSRRRKNGAPPNRNQIWRPYDSSRSRRREKTPRAAHRARVSCWSASSATPPSAEMDRNPLTSGSHSERRAGRL